MKTVQEALKVARDALKVALAICDAVPTRAHLLEDSPLKHIGKLVNYQEDDTHGYAVIRQAFLDATATIEQPEVASVDGPEFVGLLKAWFDATLCGLPCLAYSPEKAALLTFIDAHCARQVAGVQSHYDDALELIQRMLKERDEFKAQLAARGEPVAEFELKRWGDAAWEVQWSGEVPANYGQLSYHNYKVGSKLKLYTAPQPSAQPAPAFDQDEFDEMVRRGTAAWSGSQATFVEDLRELQTSAEPAPDSAVVVDERAAFEREMNAKRFFPAELDFSRTKSPSGRDEYVNAHLESCWTGWQASAALRRPNNKLKE